MRSIHKTIILMTIIALIVSGMAFAAGRGETARESWTLKLSHGDTEANPTHLTAVRFKELVEQYTDGRVTVDIFPNNTLGDEIEVAQAVRSGSVEVAMIYTGSLQPFSPSVGVLLLPYLFTGKEEAWQILDGVTDMMSERAIEEAGARILGFYEKGFRVLTNSVRPVRTLEDLQGLRIRVTNVAVAIETFRSWGIEPIPMAWDETFSALQQRVVDGQDNPYTTALTSSFYEVQDYITEIHYLLWNGPIIISERVFQQMPADIQDAITRAGREAVAYGRQVNLEMELETQDKLRELGMTLTGPPTDEDEWQRRAMSVWPRLADAAGGQEWVDEFMRERERILNQ